MVDEPKDYDVITGGLRHLLPIVGPGAVYAALISFPPPTKPTASSTGISPSAIPADETAAEVVDRPVSEPPLVGVIRCRQPIFDFGRMQAGPSLEHTFEIENNSDEPVWIEVFRGCRGVGTHSREIYCIDGNAAHNLTLSMKTAGFHGPVSCTTVVRQIPPPP